MPVNVEFYYDADNDDAENPYGSGWSTSYNQVIYYDEATERYAYKNANGTWIYFTDSGELDEEGREIWTEDTLYGIGEVGVQMFRDAETEVNDYTGVTILYGATEYIFDTAGRLVKMSDGMNENRITYVSDTGTDIASITDAVGRQYCFTYKSGVLYTVRAKSATGTSLGTAITYTITDGNLISVACSTNKISYGYDDTGRLSSIQNVDYCGYGLTYDEDLGTIASITAKAAMGTTVETDGVVTTIERTEDNEVYVTNEDIRQKYVFDGCGRIINCELQTVSESSNARSVVSQNYQCVYGYNLIYGYVTEEDGTIVNTLVDTESYDADGVIEEEAEESEAEGGSTTEEDSSTEEETETEELEEDIYETTTDAYGNITSETTTIDGERQSVEYTYSEDGNYLTAVTDENGNTLEYVYNALGLLTSTVDGNGKAISYSYNALREIVSASLSVSNLKSTGAGSLLPTLSTGKNNISTRYTYSMGRIATMVYGDSTYKFSYDVWGNISSITLDDFTLVSYDYGDNAYTGQIETMTYGNGQEVFYSYDKLGQVISVGYSGQEDRFTYFYASDGTLEEITDSVLGQSVMYRDDGYVVVSDTGAELYEYTTSDDGSYSEYIFDTTLNYAKEGGEAVASQDVTNQLGNTVFSTSVAYDPFVRIEEKIIEAGELQLTQSYEYIETEKGTGTLVEDYNVSYNCSAATENLAFHVGEFMKFELKEIIHHVVFGIAVSHDNKRIAISGKRKVYVLSWPNLEEISMFPIKEASTMVYLEDNESIFVINTLRKAFLWNGNEVEKLGKWPVPEWRETPLT